jgi:hypothetical protein
MRRWGFSVNKHLSEEIRETLEVLGKKCLPESGDFLYWRLWVLTYVLNRHSGGGQVCNYIANRAASIAKQGEEYSTWLDSVGYAEPQYLTAPKVIEVGQRFLKRLKVDAYCLVCTEENGDFVRAE